MLRPGRGSRFDVSIEVAGETIAREDGLTGVLSFSLFTERDGIGGAFLFLSYLVVPDD